MSQKVLGAMVSESPPNNVNPNIDCDLPMESQSISQHTTIEERKEVPTVATADLLLILPSELVSYIFCLACQPIHGNREWSHDFHPLHLGQLSRRYRRYAWATSELWTTIIIRLVPSKVAAQTELLKEWLARVMGRPIDIYFDARKVVGAGLGRWHLLRGPSDNAQSDTVIPMVNLLARHSLQWRRIQFYIPDFFYPTFTTDSDILEACNGGVTGRASTKIPLDLPLLKFAFFDRDSEFERGNAVALDLTHAPSLRVLWLCNFRMSPSIFERADFKQITSLSFHCVDFIDPHVLLPQLPNLEEAAFRFSTFSSTPPFPKVRHEKLHRLKVKTLHTEKEFKFLQVLNLPQLEYLSVSLPNTMRYSEVFTVSYREANLTILSVGCTIQAEYDLIEVLSSLNSLRELYVRDRREYVPLYMITQPDGLSRTFFDALHPDNDASYLPSLEVFSYQGILAVQAIDFLEPLIIRSRMRVEHGSGTNLEKIALLRKIKIQADQVSESSEFSIAGYPDSQYVWEVTRMMELRVLELIRMDGKIWQ